MTSLVLTALLAKPLPERLEAIRKDPKAIYQQLSQAAADENQALQTRWRALTTMGALDYGHFRKDLEKALKSKDWYARNAALIAILNAPRETALKWSMELLKDPSLMVRTQAVRNLVGLQAKEAEGILWAEMWNKHNFRGQESLWIRAHIAEALARMAEPGNPRSFERLIQDPDPRLYKWAIMGLEKRTGFKLSHQQEPIEIQRRKWLAKLGAGAI
jgi:HEAT repeat protein